MPNMKLAAVAAALAAAGLAAVVYTITKPGTPSTANAEASAVNALAARVHASEQIQKAQAGSLGGLQADVQKLQRAVDALATPPAKAKAKGKQIETGTVKLK